MTFPVAHYVVLVQLTKRALNTIEETPERLRKLRAMLSEEDVELETVFLTLGQYDAVALVRAPDDETVARAILSGARDWVLETETLRAFPEEDFLDIVKGLPDG